MIDEANNHFPFETGGVFMGYQAANTDIVVSELIAAGPLAKHRRFSFEPDHEYQLEQIANIHKLSSGDIIYLGDWHTHPVSRPVLSLIDKSTLTRIALTESSQNQHPLMSILGGKPEKWTLNSVQFTSGQLRPWIFSECNYRKLDVKLF